MLVIVTAVATRGRPARAGDVLGQLLAPTLCDGFDYPVGDADGGGGYLSKTDGRANDAGTEPPKSTALGGGIGIHGWSGDWKDDGKQNLTWGCISLRNRDVTALYDLVALGTTVIIHP